mmetsp:Transcript_19158/g.34626  ORF Transcript_19158/g.34626 Transcript_19158/m.34626 type:complete len:233 (+) Transcript_19158:138-836(+)
MIAVDTTVSSSSWSAFIDLCETIAPYCGVVCFLAPLPTIKQISRDKTVGKFPLLPYSSMLSNAFVWVMYGVMKDLPSVWASNAVGVLLGAYYFTTFVQHCGPMTSNLPGTVEQHLKGTSAIILFNLCLAASGVGSASDVIGKEGVVFCIILFASPLAALKTVIVTKSAASIPLPFTLACLVNCIAWSVMGLWKMRDFNIYFPNLLGLCCAVAQLALKGMYGNRSNGVKELPK